MNPSIEISFGIFPTDVSSPWPERIAGAGLALWQNGLNIYAREFVDAAIGVMNDPKLQRQFVHSSPFAISDPRYVEVLIRTVTFAIYQNRHNASDLETFPFRQIDSFACRRKHGRLDRFTASTVDPI